MISFLPIFKEWRTKGCWLRGLPLRSKSDDWRPLSATFPDRNGFTFSPMAFAEWSELGFSSLYWAQ